MDVVARLIGLASKKKKSDSLIVGSISNRKMDTGAWEFPLPYGFYSALGLVYAPRAKTVSEGGVKRKITTRKWVQGGVIYFKEGDLISSVDGKNFLQVEEGQPVGIDEHGELFHGFVRFKIYEKGIEGSILSKGRYTCTQYQFLGVVMHGLNEVKDDWGVCDA